MEGYPIGTLVRVKDTPTSRRWARETVGCICRVISPLEPHYTIPGRMVQRVDIPHGNSAYYYCFAPNEIEPVEDGDDDSREIGSWADCPWKPAGVTA